MLYIVIPVYNEGENIEKVLGEISAKVKIPHKIYVVYDFDADTTVPAVRRFITNNSSTNIELLKNRFQRGSATAVKTGFLASAENAEACLVVMGDASDQMEIVDEMYKFIESGYDVVCPSRYMQGGQQLGGPPFKKFLSSLAGNSLNFFTGIPIHDVTNSFRLYSSKVVKNLNIETKKGFAYTLELTVKSYIAGYRLIEIPTTWKNRELGQSNFKILKLLPEYLYWYFWVIFKSISKPASHN